ncbi:MAG: AraC family transcriptional regulator [Oscillospiraceae bacterium]|nr:AraC family transcriptional regulator [Oscillospiraceae bacterium]
MINRVEVHAAILKPPCSVTMITGEGAMMHWHNFPQIWYVFRGEILHTVGKETCRAKEGTCIFVPAFCPHGTTESTADAEVISISFTEEMLASAKEVLLLGDKPYVFGRLVEIFSHFEGEAKSEFDELITSLKTECEKPRGGSGSKLSTLLLRIFKRICSRVAAKKLTPTQRRRINEITQVVEYVAEDISEKLTIDALCNILNVSQAAFMRNFKKVTGMTFAKMLLSMRTRYACLQLARTEKKMIAIAGEAGFYDEAHFTHTFSENMGETPTQYRLRNKTIFDDIGIDCEDGPREIELISKRTKKRKKTTLKNR